MAKKRIPSLIDDVVEKVIKPEPQGIRAYHGSPHDFDRFDLSKIGTGEGAQAYGHGLYFAENEGVARGYRDGLTPKFAQGLNEQIGKLGEELARADAALRKAPFGSDEARAAAKLINEIEAQRLPLIEQAKGRMYEVNIRANPDDFLDWDKPLAQQSQNVVDFARKVNPDLVEYAMERGYGQDPLKVSPLGQDLWGRMTWKDSGNPEVSSKLAPRAAQRLNDQGIPGIKYLDAGSRAAGDGSRNYVVFDDALIDIIRKYGIVPGGLLGAGAAMAPSNADAAPNRADWISTDGAITGNPPWLRPDPNQRSTLGKLYDAVATDPLGTFKAAGGAIGDAVKGYFGEVRQDPGKGVADALELGVTAMGGAAPQAFWMATSPSEANAGEDAILAQRRKMMQGLLAD